MLADGQKEPGYGSQLSAYIVGFGFNRAVEVVRRFTLVPAMSEARGKLTSPCSLIHFGSMRMRSRFQSMT